MSNVRCDVFQSGLSTVKCFWVKYYAQSLNGFWQIMDQNGGFCCLYIATFDEIYCICPLVVAISRLYSQEAHFICFCFALNEKHWGDNLGISFHDDICKTYDFLLISCPSCFRLSTPMISTILTSSLLCDEYQDAHQALSFKWTIHM